MRELMFKILVFILIAFIVWLGIATFMDLYN